MSGGHSGEEIPVPIPNTEVKLTNADDTAFRGGKVGSCQAFFYLTGVKRKSPVDFTGDFSYLFYIEYFFMIIC